MRITFLCGSLEPGRDGVGDYTRLLAKECVRHGHACSLVALNDRHIETVGTAVPLTGSGESVTLRLPASLPWSERIELAKRQIEASNPDWISLQFVCYGFHPKGLIHGLGDKLRPVVAGRNLHLMFHELWIGDARIASLKHRLVGAFQRRFILQMVQKLKPKVIHSSTPVYVGMLGQHGVEATQLPLFGNIPVIVNDAHSSGFPTEFAAERISGDRNDWWVAILFGTIHPEWKPEPLFRILRSAATRSEKRIGVVSVGRLTAAGEKLWQQMRDQDAGDLAFVRMGEQPASRISSLLQMADFGIATSPLQLIGKSGSASAMIEHGLPVIANRDDWHPRCPTLKTATHDPLVHPLDEHLEGKLLRGLKRGTAAARSPSIAADFVNNLLAALA